MDKKNEIWVYAEVNRSEPTSVVYELIGKAQELAEQIKDIQVAAVVLGNSNGEAVEKLKDYVARVYSVEHAELTNYRCDVYAKAVANLVEAHRPEYLFFGATAAGSELAPTVATTVKTGLAAHCIDLRYNGERLNCIVPAFGGKVVSEIYIPNARPVMASVRPGILGSVPKRKDAVAEVVRENVDCLNGVESAEEYLEFIPSQRADNDIEKADVVVSAGRGISSDKAWESLNKLAQKLGGSVAWSRSFIDTGRVKDESGMIGTSGKAVKPKLLINVGISGATQYTCGIEKSKTIISINRDPRAKIFEHSDYGVVGDAEKVLNAVLAKI